MAALGPRGAFGKSSGSPPFGVSRRFPLPGTRERARGSSAAPANGRGIRARIAFVLRSTGGRAGRPAPFATGDETCQTLHPETPRQARLVATEVPPRVPAQLTPFPPP